MNLIITPVPTHGAKTFAEYEATIDKKNVEVLEIPNCLDFGEKFDNNSGESIEGGKLVIQGYPKLKRLEATNCNLKQVEINNCSNLEELFLNHNQIEKLTGLDALTNLKRLEVMGNKLKSLQNIENLTQLKFLYCSHNELTELKLEHLKNLVYLVCNKNYLSELNVVSLTKLVFLDCSHNKEPKEFEGQVYYNYLTKITLGDNDSLEILDIAENDVVNLNFPPLPRLKMLSVRENRHEAYSNTLTLRSPHLTHLECYSSDIKKIIFHPDYPLKNPNQLRICNNASYTNPDGTLNTDAATEWEKLTYEILRERQKQQTEFYAGTKRVDFSHWNLRKEVILTGEGWSMLNGILYKIPPSVEAINVGNNFIETLTLSNFPNLKRVIFSHNKIDQSKLKIINCPQLTAEGITWTHKMGNTDYEMSIDYELFLDILEHPENFTLAEVLAVNEWMLLMDELLTSDSERVKRFREIREQKQSNHTKKATQETMERINHDTEEEFRRKKAEETAKQPPPAPPPPPTASPQPPSPAAALKAKLRAAFAPLLAQFRAAIQKGDKTQQQNLLAEMEQLLQEGGTHLSAEQQAEFTQVKNIWRKQEAQERRVGYGVALFTTGLLVGILVGIGRQLKAFVRPRKK